MKDTEKLYNALTNIDDEFIEEASENENTGSDGEATITIKDFSDKTANTNGLDEVKRLDSNYAVTDVDKEETDKAFKKQFNKNLRLVRWIAAAAVIVICAGLAIGIAAFGLRAGASYSVETSTASSDTTSNTADYSAALGYGAEDSVASEEIYEYDTASFGAEAEEGYDTGTVSSTETVNVNDAAAEGSGRKLITTMNLDMETLEFDSALEEITKQAEALGGYVENSYIYNGSNYSYYKSTRYADLTLRIPEDELDNFINSASALCNVTGKSKNVEDVTLTYVDLESRKTALETEQETLLSLMEKAETVEDLISIESQLTEVRYQLESIESQLRTYDNKINYSTVYVYLSEVEDLTDTTEAETFGEKISKGFANSIKAIGKGIKNFAAWVIIYLPYIVIIAVIAVAAVLIVRAILRRKFKKSKKRSR